VQKSSALQCDVTCADQERFSRRLLKAEQIVGSDSKLPGARNVRIFGPASGGQDKLLGSHRLLDAILVDGLDSVWAFEAGVLVKIGDLKFVNRNFFFFF
jgi:hypothetical protein